MWGLALDTIVALDAVLANGSIIHATSTSYPNVYFVSRTEGTRFLQLRHTDPKTGLTRCRRQFRHRNNFLPANTASPLQNHRVSDPNSRHHGIRRRRNILLSPPTGLRHELQPHRPALDLRRVYLVRRKKWLDVQHQRHVLR